MESKRTGEIGLRFRPRLEALEDRTTPVITVNNVATGISPVDLAKLLAGPGVRITNVSYKGTAISAGQFSGALTTIGFDAGVVLSSGNSTTSVIPPNISRQFTTVLNTTGDLSLSAIAQAPTFDATVLEFDIIPQGETLKFQYVFSTDEYNDFVAGNQHDVIGLFVNNKNYGLTPGTNLPVNSQNINLNLRSEFYVNNARNFVGELFPTAQPVAFEMDGFTKVLTVTARVNPGVLNHVRLGIADTLNRNIDSNLLLRAGSFSAPAFQTFRPQTYVYRTLAQNQGRSGPLPVGGGAKTATMDGVVTVFLTTDASIRGPIKLYFRNLPAGVTLANASGIDPVTGRPYMIVPTGLMTKNGAPVRVAVKFASKNPTPLGTFFIGPYFVDATLA